MEKKSLSEFNSLTDLANYGSVTRPVYVVSMEDKENKTGKTQVMVQVKDGVDTNTVAIFDSSVKVLQEKYPFFTTGSIVIMDITKKDPYFNATTNIQEAIEEYDLSDIADIATDKPEVYWNYIVDRVRKASDEKGETEFEPLSTLVTNVYEEFKEKLLWSSSALANHHMGISGNIVHTAEVLNICETLLGSCLGKAIDKEILLAAAALHDVGKIMVYETDEVGVASLTLNGYAMGGHHWDSLRIVYEETKKGNYNPESLMILQNAIASHHGAREYGDVAEPLSLEAVWLNVADNLSAKHYEIRKVIESLEPGTITSKKVYPLEHKVYRRINQ